MSTLTTTQKSILEAAAGRPDGAIYPMPNHIMGGAALKVIKALTDKKLIRDAGNNDWRIADEGFHAIGLEPPKPVEDFEADVAAAEATFTESKPRRRRENSKQAQVIEMLKRPEGATIWQECQMGRTKCARRVRAMDGPNHRCPDRRSNGLARSHD